MAAFMNRWTISTGWFSLAGITMAVLHWGM